MTIQTSDATIGFQRVAKPRPLDATPYYALAIWPGALGTNGGPRIDANGCVARAGGGVVPGLYAAGNTAANARGSRGVCSNGRERTFERASRLRRQLRRPRDAIDVRAAIHEQRVPR